MSRLATKPAVIVCVALLAGWLYRLARLPEIDGAVIGALASAGLAGLVFVAGLQFRLSRLKKQSPAALRLAVIAGPLFLLATAISAFVMLPSLSIWSALLIGAALMLNGAAVDRRAITSSLAPADLKNTVELESAAALVIGLPLVIIIELLSSAPFSAAEGLIDFGVFRAVIGFAMGGTLGLIGGLASRRFPNINPLTFAIGTGILAYCLAPIGQGDAIIAAGAAGLIWSEEARLSGLRRRRLRRQFDQAIKPAAYALFGFVLGPAVLQADVLMLLFAVATVTVLRIGPRLVALSRMGLGSEQQAFIAWFGGAPGAASALYLLKLMGLSALLDQEMVLTIGATAIFIAIIGTRLSSKPLASYFIRQHALARKRRYYSS